MKGKAVHFNWSGAIIMDNALTMNQEINLITADAAASWIIPWNQVDNV